MPTNIALMGPARSGKDSIAARLVERHGYTRVAFADPLKRMAETVSPIVPTTTGAHVRLAALVDIAGWENAKDTYPEVRRLLQHMGQAVRDLDPSVWVRTLCRAVAATDGPVVVTDVRYPNEADALSVRGFRLIRVIRPGQDSVSTHVSETALDSYSPDALVVNAGSLAELHMRADALAM